MNRGKEIVLLAGLLVACGMTAWADDGESPATTRFWPSASSNTIVDRIRGGFAALARPFQDGNDATDTLTTAQVADRVVTLIALKLDHGKPFAPGDVPSRFEPTDNNHTEQYAQGAAFAKIQELVERCIAAQQGAGAGGTTSGVFIAIHNFILSNDATGQGMTSLLIRARKAGVPVLLSYDTFGTHVYGSLSDPGLKELAEAGVGLLPVRSMTGERMDHRKIYFLGTGDGHVFALAGGQGWEEQYSGKDWESIPAVEEGRACLLYSGAGQEPWLDHMRLLDGEAALQGALNFLGRFAAKADKALLARGLGLAACDHVRATLERLFVPTLARAGGQVAVILNNTDWDRRPITEVWYANLSDPDVTNIRIVMPYITDPVFRTKLRAAVKAGKDLRILMPGKSDNVLAQLATQYLFRDLLAIHRQMQNDGAKCGVLELKEWRTHLGEPIHVHMKYGIFRHATRRDEDLVIDGSYNATALEARSGEMNADIAVSGAQTAAEAAKVVDGYLAQAADSNPGPLRSIAGFLTVVALRGFM